MLFWALDSRDHLFTDSTRCCGISRGLPDSIASFWEQPSLVRPVPGKEPRPAGYSAARQRKRWLPLISAIGVAAAIAVGVWFFAVASRKTNEANPIPVAAAVPAKSIAVLPFESLSGDKENVYFADGVQDEILNNVAKIAQLTVISRTSVMQYRAGEKRDLRQIANALRVANVLEGTVQRNANRVRINTELIDARSDKTIWADSYDRDLTDIFGIQSEVAQTVAAKLAATLSPDEKRNIERKPTENIEAYDLYLKAKRLLTIVGSTYDSGDVSKPLGDAVDLLEQAVRLDPKFALAYCAAVEAHDFLYVLVDPSPQQLALGDGALNRALEWKRTCSRFFSPTLFTSFEAIGTMSARGSNSRSLDAGCQTTPRQCL